MARLLVFSLLLTLVYSWEELRYFLRRVLFGILNGNKNPFPSQALHIDKLVGNFIMLSSIPISLTYFLVSQDSLVYKLVMILLQLTLLGSLAFATHLLLRRIRQSTAAVTYEQVFLSGFSVFSFFLPITRIFTAGSSVEYSLLAKLAVAFSIPPLVGISLRYGAGYADTDGQFLPNLDILISVLVSMLFLRIGIEFLEYYFRTWYLSKLFSYVRILAGVGLVIVILIS